MNNRNTGMNKRLIAGAKAIEELMREQERQKLLKKADDVLLSDILSEIAELLYQTAELASDAADLIEEDEEKCEGALFPYFIMEVHG